MILDWINAHPWCLVPLAFFASTGTWWWMRWLWRKPPPHWRENVRG